MYYVYFMTCCDGTLYCGLTTDLTRRVWEHNHSVKGAKYTRSRRPVSLSWYMTCADRREASQWEYRLKRLKRMEKNALCQSPDNPVLKEKKEI